ncbi:MAG: hypothetical protein M5U15_08505 [Kiritimatiellae bacterium]|nr:hypothetical protein [Kiritimatiellia bacterium]
MTLRTFGIVLFTLSLALVCEVQSSYAETRASYSERFEDELAAEEWQRSYTESNPEWMLPGGAFLPMELRIRDLETGKSTALRPAVAYEYENRRRWGGHDAGVDWVLVLDRATDSVSRTVLSIQLKSSKQRFLQLEVGPRMNTVGASLFHTQTIARIERGVVETSDTVPTRLGAQGERARQPFGIIEGPSLIMLAGVDPSEPRLFQIAARPDDGLFGIRFETVLSPETSNFPGRAAFRCVFAAWPAAPDTYAFEQASEIWSFLWPENYGPQLSAPKNATASIQDTHLPLVFTPRIRSPQTLDEHSAWRPLAPPDFSAASLDNLEDSLPALSPAESGNFARDARVRISVDSTDTGFSNEALADGVTNFIPNDAIAQGWRSANTATTHRIRLDLPRPTALADLTLHWPVVDGAPLTPRALRVDGVSVSGDIFHLAKLDGQGPTQTTHVAIPSLQLEQITVEMPAGGGAAGFSNQLWLCEVELR